MDVTQIYLRQLHKSHRRLSRTEEQKLARKAQRGDVEARETLMLSVMPLAVEIAKKYQGRGLDLGDLIQAANMGVIRAVKGFDPERGCRLTTYAMTWIKQKILYELQYRAPLIHIPRYLLEKQNKKGLSEEERNALKKIQNSVASLDVEFESDDGSSRTPAALVEAKYDDLDAAIERTRELAELDRKIERLPERERLVIRRRLAGKTLVEVGKEMGVTRERVRQIETSAKQSLAWMYGIAAPLA